MSRSYLFVPGNTPSMLQNLDVFDSDAIIIDLEDSVTIFDKDAARFLVHNFLSKFRMTSPEIFVRINDVDSPYFLEDIEQLEPLEIQGYVLPKATPESVRLLQEQTNKKIIPIIETPKSVLQMEHIAEKKQVIGLLLGAEDLTKEMGIERTLEGTELMYARSKMVMVCSAYQIDSIDTPYTDKDNEEGIWIDCNHAKSFGFTSKSSIHPNHVSVINQTFSPSALDIKHAMRIIAKADKEQKGAFSLDGKMIDVPVIERARKVLEKAKKYKLL